MSEPWRLRRSEAIDPRAAAELVRKYGFVLIEGVVPQPVLQQLLPEFTRAFNAKRESWGVAPVQVHDHRSEAHKGVLIDFRPEGGNHDLNRWNMHLPSKKPFLEECVFADEVVVGIIDDFLEPNYALVMMASDIPLPGSGFQNAHQDYYDLGITVNIPLVDMTLENGPLEIWPRSHLTEDGRFTTGRLQLSNPQMRRLMETVEGVNVVVPAGTAIIRDHRLVHRGTRNRSDSMRPMMSLNYCSARPATFPAVVDAGARLSKALRVLGRATQENPAGKKVLLAGNTMGRVVEFFAGTDRHYRRPIPVEIWNGFSDTAKRLLRYAFVTDGNEVLEPASVGASARFVRDVVTRTYRAVTAKRDGDPVMAPPTEAPRRASS